MFKKLCLLLLTFCLLFTLLSMDIVASDNNQNVDFSKNESTQYSNNEIIVLTNYYVDVSLFENGACNFHGLSILGIRKLFKSETPEEIENHIATRGELFSYCITIDPSVVSVEEAIEILSSDEAIICAEYNYTIELENNIPSVVPDSAISRSGELTQWAHTNLGMDGSSGVWSTGFVGSSDVTVAVLDVGFVSHSDLQNNLNFGLSYDATSFSEDVTNDNNHGNFVSGIIGADYNDGGINGICRSVNIIPIKISVDGAHTTNATYVMEGVNWALDVNSDIINLSFEMGSIHASLRATITAAQVLFITTAGNKSVDMVNDSGTLHKRHNDPYWIVVGSSNQSGGKSAHSNYSSLYCDLFAPGENIVSTSLTGHTTQSGTSFAAPHVAAACALIMSHATHLSPLQVKDIVMENVTQVSGFDSYCVSGGILNIKKAIDAIYSEDRTQYGSYTKGDINNNGAIDARDYLLAKRICEGTYSATAAQISAADIDGDGVVEVSDYTAINNYYNRTYYFTPI